MAGKDKGAGACLSAHTDSGYLGDFCHYRYTAAGGLSGRYDRNSWHGNSGGSRAVYKIYAGIWYITGSLHPVCYALSGTMVS